MVDEMFGGLSFDEMVKLAKDNPTEFFARRAKIISEFIDSAPERIRAELTDIQSQIDMIRAVEANPLKTSERLLALCGKNLSTIGKKIEDARRIAVQLQDKLCTPPNGRSEDGAETSET